MFKLLKKSIAYLLTLLTISTFLTAINISPASAATCTGTFASDTLWKPVRNTTGGLLTDPINDVGSGSDGTNVDIYGTEATATTPAGSAIDWYSTGSSGCFQFRMRLAANAVTGGKLDNKNIILYDPPIDANELPNLNLLINKLKEFILKEGKQMQITIPQ